MGADRSGEGFGAVVLTGGSAARMGGADKAGLVLGAATLLERALAATAGAAEVVVVGEPAPTSRRVTWTRENPPGGGPAAGLLAGIDAFRGPWEVVAVLAVDMPRVTGATFDRLLAALRQGADGALLVDEGGRRQLLCGAYRLAALRRVRPRTPAEEAGLPVRRLLQPLHLVEVAGVADEAHDVDTWEDLQALRERP
jgi:molybdopterin-guanine dinucleotide biosynthesis protein A